MNNNEIIDYIKKNNIQIQQVDIDNGLAIVMYNEHIADIIFDFGEMSFLNNSYIKEIKITPYVLDSSLENICVIKNIDKNIILNLIKNICEEQLKISANIFERVSNKFKKRTKK